MTAPDPGGPPGPLGRASPIVGLRREREVLTVALDTGRHAVIEGRPGTGNSTLLRDIARPHGIPKAARSRAAFGVHPRHQEALQALAGVVMVNR